MRPRFTIPAVVAVALAVIGIIKWRSEPPRCDYWKPLQARAADLDELRIVVAGTSPLILKKLGSEWQLVEPLVDRADADSVEDTLAGLGAMTFGPVVTADPEKYAELGIDDAQAMRVTPMRNGRAEQELTLSKNCDFARLDADARVYAVRGLNRLAINRKLKLWRDRSIMSFSRTLVARMEITIGSQRLAFARRSSGSERGDALGHEAWSIAAGSELIGGAVDPAVPAGLASILSRLEANTFVDSGLPDAAGLTTPHASLAAVLVDGTRYELLVGARVGEEVYVKRPGSPRMWLVFAAPFETVWQAPALLRDLTVLQIEPSQVVSVEVRTPQAHLTLTRAGDGPWKAAPAIAELDQARVNVLLQSLRSLTAKSIAEVPVPAQTGLSNPRSTLTIRGRSGTLGKLSVGAEMDGGVFVRAEGRPEVFVVSSFALSRILRGPKELASAPQLR